jgi:alkanesulfonate monooxygenase SsuD/methylene tetrahydromethanopterin reductase-like flavin-dependent oxidoreductase (luciferase family)
VQLGLFQNIQWPETASQSSQFKDCIDQALRAEELGFDSCFFVEHHFTRHGILSATLTLLSYVAARTSRIRLGTAVLVLPFHDPVRLVEEAATVDLLSDGRLDLGVGRGFQWTEFNGFDIAIDDSTARFTEALDIILKAWRSPDRFTHEGNYWRYNDISVEPRPVQVPHPPVWVAAGSEESATRVGRLGLRMQLSSGVRFDRIPILVEAYQRGLQEGGHSFHREHVLLSRITHIESSRRKAWEVAEPHFNWFRKMAAEATNSPEQRAASNFNPLTPKLTGPIGSEADDPGFFFCTPDECCRVIEEIGAMGVGQVIFQGNWGGMPQEDVIRSVDLLGAEVLPHFAAARNPA